MWCSVKPSELPCPGGAAGSDSQMDQTHRHLVGGPPLVAKAWLPGSPRTPLLLMHVQSVAMWGQETKMDHDVWQFGCGS